MTTLPISETSSVALDGSGNGTISLGPYGPSETWTPSNVSVICSSNTKEAVCKIYVGPKVAPQYFKDLTVDGSTGDATDRANVLVANGNFIWAVWTGGDAGATATLNVDGTKTY